MPRKMRDLTGLQFERLTVIKEVGRIYSGKEVLWLCKCSCGNYKEVCATSLLGGRTRSCGCLNVDAARGRIKDLSGMRFTRLLVVEYAGQNNQNNATWKCMCD